MGGGWEGRERGWRRERREEEGGNVRQFKRKIRKREGPLF